ncbi:MAG: hypothetical protein Q4B77_03140 [Coriobacteriaceae bacterium]|nr:hypothetical protein [Coriobacteriaceae bacterium]
MAYYTSNAAYAYDALPESYPGYAPAQNAPAPEPHKPRKLGVVTGAGREASQDVSPQFTHCLRVVAALVAVLFVLGVFRVTLASMTAGALNEAATLSNQLTEAQLQSADLEVMRSVYGSSTRIRDLAEGYGMVAAQEGVTLDFTEYVDSSAEGGEGLLDAVSGAVSGTGAAQ